MNDGNSPLGQAARADVATRLAAIVRIESVIAADPQLTSPVALYSEHAALDGRCEFGHEPASSKPRQAMKRSGQNRAVPVFVQGCDRRPGSPAAPHRFRPILGGC